MCLKLFRLALTTLVAIPLALSADLRAPQSPRPNIVVILVDDFGYGDLSIHGCKDILTPHIDSLAAGGVRCGQGYISAPQCSPTRAGLLTGRYQQRFGHEYNAAVEGSNLSLEEVTLSERLKWAGYKTGMVGKWHLGLDDEHHPLARGFDEFFGFVGGANPYLPQGPQSVVPRILRGKQPADEKSFLTAAFAREANAFIDRHRQEPFFLYLAFNATHGPLQAPQEYLDKFQSLTDPKRRIYAAMTSALDDAVGSVLDKLKASCLDQNTLVFFINDNGGPTDVNGSRNDPFRGAKGEVREGGIRTPFLVRWPTKLPAGQVYDRPVIQLDIFPTVLAAAGISLPADSKALDGVDLLPYLSGNKPGSPHEVLYWRFNFPSRQPEFHKWAIRKGDWKLFTDFTGNRQRSEVTGPESVKLVNLAADVREEHDLTEQHPEIARELKSLWDDWNKQLPQPSASSSPARRKKKN